MSNEKKLTHIDLFSGIGGFALAAEWAVFKTVVFCEKEKFCQELLKKRFGAIANPKSRRCIAQNKKIQTGRNTTKRCDQPIPIIPEIRDFDGTKYRGATLLTGGFPCQPFSVAGQRRGKEDDRYLWPEMLRVISEAKPHWILAENVPGIFRMALDTVLADLEGEGYTTGTFIIPACCLNAPHRRNRIWIVANCDKKGLERTISKRKTRPERCPSKLNDDTSDPECERQKRGKSQEQPRHKEGVSEGNNSHASDSAGGRQLECLSDREKKGNFGESDRWDIWQENWYEIATRFCRVDDGISDRVHRLKALGNAIVPQIAYQILKNIAWIEKELHGN